MTPEAGARRQLELLGELIRTQRQQAELTLRELAARTNVSNPYLSQIERGLHEPSVRVLKAIAGALNLSAESLLQQAGILETPATGVGVRTPSVEEALRADPALSNEQREALLSVYRSFVDDLAVPPKRARRSGTSRQRD
ncbi:MAG: helix-turn-helix domain-containing protein [Microthrixaceae bacterium]